MSVLNCVGCRSSPAQTAGGIDGSSEEAAGNRSRSESPNRIHAKPSAEELAALLSQLCLDAKKVMAKHNVAWKLTFDAFDTQSRGKVRCVSTLRTHRVYKGQIGRCARASAASRSLRMVSSI